MPNLIQEAKQQIETLLAAAYEKAAEKGTLPAGAVLSGTVEIPKDTANGDFAANHAMTGARAMHMAPKKIAEALIAELEEDVTPIDGVIAFMGSDTAAGIFGPEGAAKMLAHMKEVKAAGGEYCDCGACSAGKKILDRRAELF